MEGNKKSVLITGCSPNSIGEALALQFHKKGYFVCATCLPQETLPELEALGMLCSPLDVTSDASVAEFSTFLHKHLNRLDVLINSAGINYVMPVLDLDMGELHRTYDINVFGTIRVIQAVSDLLIQTKGTIVNVGSLAAYAPYVFGAAYNGSKAALLAMGNTLRIELSPFDVKVMTILSGPVESGLVTRATRVLPSTSLYLPVQAEFKSRMAHKDHGVKTLSREKFAESVFSKVAAPPNNLWIAPWNRAVWVLETFGLQSVWARIFTGMFRLDKLRKVKL